MSFKSKMKEISMKITQVYVSIKSNKTPWYAKTIGVVAVIYALSPIDLIPDFIPIIGYLDDLIILPLLITLTIKLIPKQLWKEYEEEAKYIWEDGKPVKWYYALPVISIWLIVVALIVFIVLN
ncbi:MAG: DUF1232 domain-containing protein [Firmicutes bacterium]|nr:DUF1232 domain-containing protein [Bacillota bacterium]